MRFAYLLTIGVLLACAPLKPSAAAPAERVRSITDFDADWRFQKGDAPGAEAPGFSDASWRTLRLPHDWSIEGPFDEKNPTGKGGAYLPSGPGAIAAVDNGDVFSHEPFQATQRRAFLGQCIAILKASSPGASLTLTASAPGLAEGTIRIETLPASPASRVSATAK